MKKIIATILIFLFIVTPTIENVSATTVFLTSDNILGVDADIDMLNSIKNYIEELSNGKLQVVIDNNAPGPGEGTRAIESNTDVSVSLAAPCAGNLQILAKYAQNSNKQIIFVNVGTFDLFDNNSLRRAWDDNYSKDTFAGIRNPGLFLNDAGIGVIQPLKEYPSNEHNGVLDHSSDEVNRYIATEVIKQVNSYNNNSSKKYDNNLIIQHELNPSIMAEASKALISSGNSEMNLIYNSYSAEEILYLTSSYLNGNSLKTPEDYKAPNNPLKYSLFTKNSYSIYEYMEMAGIVKNYMDEHHQAPDFIKYKGAIIGYYDLTYNFAKITQTHTDMYHMDFERDYTFDKVNDSILVNLLPIIIILTIILFAYLLYKKIKRR